MRIFSLKTTKPRLTVIAVLVTIASMVSAESLISRERTVLSSSHDDLKEGHASSNAPSFPRRLSRRLPETPTQAPTYVAPTLQPTSLPSLVPSLEPTALPTLVPTALPTLAPTLEPTALPTLDPTLAPTSLPSLEPTLVPTATPTLAPTLQPTSLPTLAPTGEPTTEPTGEPTTDPTLLPIPLPTSQPTSAPSQQPTSTPTARPRILSINPKEFDTRGGTKVNITGTNFREGSFSAVVVTYGPTGVEYQAKGCQMLPSSTALSEDSTFLCKTSPGVGSGHSWIVAFGDSSSSEDSCKIDAVCSSYFVPVISTVTSSLLGSLQELSTSGGDHITLTGDYFGPLNVGTAINASYSVISGSIDPSHLALSVFRAAFCKLTKAHVEVICVTAAGVGSHLKWTIAIADQASGPSDTSTSYVPPVVADISSTMHPSLSGFRTIGGGDVIITGMNFGPAWDINQVFASYLNPELSGLAAEAYSGISCKVGTVDTQIICEMAVGVGFGHEWLATVGGQSSNWFSGRTTSYAVPNITALSPNEINTDGSTSITLTGENFGPNDTNNFVVVTYWSVTYTDPGRYGDLMTATKTAVSCFVEGGDHDRILCDNSAVGIGSGLAFHVVVGGQKSSRSSVTIAYAPPAVASLVPLEGLATNGGEVITITGTNFGPMDQASNIPEVRYKTASGTPGATPLAMLFKNATNCSVTEDHIEITCFTAVGVGRNVRLFVTIGEQESVQSSAATSYAEPSVTGVVAAAAGVNLQDLLTAGGENITVIGTNFGPLDGAIGNNVAITYGDGSLGSNESDCRVSAAHTTISCMTAAGVGANLSLVATVGGQRSDVSADGLHVSYRPPFVVSMNPNSGSSLGDTDVTVSGIYFGNSNAKGTAVFLDGNASKIKSVSETAIVAKLPPSTASLHYIVVSVGGQYAKYSRMSGTRYYAYRPVGLRPGFGPVRGGTAVRVDGKSFFNSKFIGLRIGDVDHMDDDSVSEGVDFVECKQGYFDFNDKSFVFTIPELPIALRHWSSGHVVLNVYLNLNNFTWSRLEEGTFRYYDPIEVSSVSPLSGPTNGGTLITVTGSGFVHTDVIIGRIAAHSNIPGNAGRNSIATTDLLWARNVGEDLIQNCTFINSTSFVCQTNMMNVTEVVDFSFSIDSPKYNFEILFSNTTVPFYFYNQPELFPGDPGSYIKDGSEFSTQINKIMVRAAVSIQGVSMRDLVNVDIELFQKGVHEAAGTIATGNPTVGAAVESMRYGIYSDVGNVMGGDLDGFFGSCEFPSSQLCEVTIVVQFTFRDQPSDEEEATVIFEPFNTLLNNASTIQGFGGVWIGATANGTQQYKLKSSPVVTPQIGSANTSRPYKCTVNPAACLDRYEPGFTYFYSKDGQGTMVTIAGFGIVPTPDNIAVKFNGLHFTMDAMAEIDEVSWAHSRHLHVSTASHDTVIVFYIPDREVSEGITGAIEISLNGVDFTDHGVLFTYFTLDYMYQENSIEKSVYGPEHSETELHVMGGGFVYAAVQTDVDEGSYGIRGTTGSEVHIEFGGKPGDGFHDPQIGERVDHGCITNKNQSGACEDFYCKRNCRFVSKHDLEFMMPRLGMKSDHGCMSNTDGVGIWRVRFSLNGGVSWAPPYGIKDGDDSYPRDFRVYSTPTATKMTPRAGPVSGGTNITIVGNFHNTGFVDIKGKGGGDSTSGIFKGCRVSTDDSNSIRCRLKAGNDSQALQPTTISVTIDTDDVVHPKYLDLVDYAFIYYRDYTLDIVSPDLGMAVKGGTLLSITGYGLEVIDSFPEFFVESKCRLSKQFGDTNDALLYEYRSTRMVPLDVVNHAGSNFSDITVAVAIDTNALQAVGALNSNCSDLRVYYETSRIGRYPVHYLEHCGSSDSTLWVRLDVISVYDIHDQNGGHDGLYILLDLNKDLDIHAISSDEFWNTTAQRVDGVFSVFDNFAGFGARQGGTGDWTQWTHVRNSDLKVMVDSGSVEDYQDAPIYEYNFDDGGEIVIFGQGRTPNFMHTTEAIKSHAFSFIAMLKVKSEILRQCVRFFVGPLGASLDDAPMVVEYCYAEGGNVEKSINGIPDGGCGATITPTSPLKLTVTVDWREGGHVDFIDSVCGQLVRTGAAHFRRNYKSNLPKFLFLGAGPSDDDGDFHVSLSHLRVWPTANLTIRTNFADPGLLSMTSSKLIVCKTPRGMEEDVYGVQVGINGQQYTNVEDPLQRVTMLQPLINITHIPTPLIEKAGVVVVGTIGGGEVLTMSGNDLTRTITGAMVRFRNRFHEFYEPASIDLAGEKVNIHTTPNYVSSGRESIEATQVALGLNGQQFIHTATIKLATPDKCRIINEDFDFIRNLDDGYINADSDASSTFGAHHSYWESIEGGRTVDACFVDSVNKITQTTYQYQHLVFDGNGTSGKSTRILQTVPIDTSMCLSSLNNSSNTFEVSFNFTFLDPIHHEGFCDVWGNVGGNRVVANPVDFEASTDGGVSWIQLARFQNNTRYWEAADGMITSNRGLHCSYVAHLGKYLDLISPQLKLRWIQRLNSSFIGDPWAIDSIAVDVVPAAQGRITIDDVIPRSGVLTGGTVILLKGIFPDLRTPLTCRFTYTGMMTSNDDTMHSRFRRWNNNSVDSMMTKRHNSTYVSCEVPPYYGDVNNEARCQDPHKKLCTSCCVLTISLQVCGSPITYTPVNTYHQGLSSNKDKKYLLQPFEFMYYQQIAVTGLFPNTGAFSEYGSLIQLSESLTIATIFFSSQIKVRFTVSVEDMDNQVMDFRGSVNTGVGMLTKFPQVGSSYGELGFPLGNDANVYRMQAMYKWTDLQTVYYTSKTIQELSTERLIARCKEQGYFESIYFTATSELYNCENILDKNFGKPSFVGKVDRIQLKIKTAPLRNIKNFRISIDTQIADSYDSLYEVTGKSTRFYSSLELPEKEALSKAEFDVNGVNDNAHGWPGKQPGKPRLDNLFSDDTWVTFYLDEVQELLEFYHIILEFSENCNQDCGLDQNDNNPTLYYQHTYDKRTLRWFSKDALKEVYPFNVPNTVPFSNMTWGQRVPMINFCIFPDACPQQAFVEGTMTLEDGDYTSPEETYVQQLKKSTAQLSKDKLNLKVPSEKKTERLNRVLAEDGTSDWSLCTIEVALNGQDFHAIDANNLPFYIYDSARVYFEPTSLAPLIGPDTGDTEITLNLPTKFPFFDPGGFYDFQEGIVFVVPIDNVVVMYSQKDSTEGYKEFSVGKVENGFVPDTIYASTPNMKPGIYTVSLSINGRNYWPPINYKPSANCSYQTNVRTLEGDCIDGETRCMGYLADEGQFVNTKNGNMPCLLCCVTETSFYVYKDFDIGIIGEGWEGGDGIWGYSSGYDPGDDATPRTFDIAVDINKIEYVDDTRVCCFFMAPRNPISAEVLEPYEEMSDDYADRILKLPPVYGESSAAMFPKEFPREVPAEHSINDICGGAFISLSTVSGSSKVKCVAPPIPVWVNSDYGWKIRISVNGQNHHGISINTDPMWEGLDGIEYHAKPCAAGYYSTSYDQVCLQCSPGTQDDRTDFEFVEISECFVCSEGKYQDEYAQIDCKNCPRGPTEFATEFYSTTMDLEGNVITGQHSPDACMCKEGFWLNPNMKVCTVEGKCCDVCPTPGGLCKGGIGVKKMQSVFEDGIPLQASYYDPKSKNQSNLYYHMMPFAQRGYYRIAGPIEGKVAECAPPPFNDDDTSDPGSCIGGVEDAHRDIQYDNLCGSGYRQSFMCADCIRGFYKDGDTCTPCPTKDPFVLTGMGMVGVFGLWAFAKYARHLNGLASPRIFYCFGIVTSSFMYFDITWPAEIVEFLRIIDTYIAIDLDILHAECEMPNLSFEEGTYVTLSLPFILGEIFCLIYVFEVFIRKLEIEYHMEASDSAADRSRTIVHGMWIITADVCREVYHQIFQNLIFSLLGPQGLIFSVVFLLFGWLFVPLHLVFVAAFKRLIPHFQISSRRTIIDTRISNMEESWGRVFEFSIWFVTYSLGGIPAIIISIPPYIMFVLWTFMWTVIEMGAIDDEVEIGKDGRERLCYKTYTSSLLQLTSYAPIRWSIIFPLVMVLVPFDVILTTISYLLKIARYLNSPPTPVTIAEWPFHAGLAANMVFLPTMLWIPDGPAGSFLSHIIHCIAGHLALLLYSPVASVMFLLGRIVAAMSWLNTPGYGRFLDRPRTAFMKWRHQVIKDGDLEALQAMGNSIPYGYIRVRVNQTWMSSLFMNYHKLTHVDEVRQIAAIDHTRPTEPQRIHIEEPLVDFPIKNERFLYMPRKEIDCALQKRFRKPRADITLPELIRELNRVKGNFYVRRARKREVLQELEALMRHEQKQVESEMNGEGDISALGYSSASGGGCDGGLGADGNEGTGNVNDNNATKSRKVANTGFDKDNAIGGRFLCADTNGDSLKCVDKEGRLDNQVAGEPARPDPTRKQASTHTQPLSSTCGRHSHRSSPKKAKSSKRSARATEYPVRERALDMLGLLKGRWTQGLGRISTDNSTELTVLTGNMFKGNYNWRGIRKRAWQNFCGCCFGGVEFGDGGAHFRNPGRCDLLLGRGRYEGFPLEVRLAFLATASLLSSLFPCLFVVVVVVTIFGQLGFIPNLRLTKTKALRSEVIVRFRTHNLDGSSIAGASIAAKKRLHASRKKRRRARANWKRAYHKARILQAVVRKHVSKQGHRDYTLKFGSEEEKVQRARALGLFETYKGDFLSMRRSLSINSDRRNASPTSDHRAAPTFQPGIDPRDPRFENWLHRGGATVFAKRRKREAAHERDNTIKRLKEYIWDAAVSFDVDIRTERLIMSAGGHANEDRTAKMRGLFVDNESMKFAQQFQDSSATIRFQTRAAKRTEMPEFVALMHFSDPEVARTWKRAIELEASNPDSHIKGYDVQWRYSVFRHFGIFVGTTIFYLALLPIVLGISSAMFIWRHLCISVMNTVRKWIHRYEKISFATIQRRSQGKGKTGRAMIHDAMDRYTFQTAWLRDFDSVDDRAAMHTAGRDSARSGSMFFVEKTLQHSLTTYITTFPEHNAELKLYRNTVSQLSDFAENHEVVDRNDFNPRRIANKYINAFVMILSFSHVTLSLTVLELVDCSMQPGLPYETLDVDPAIRCNTQEHSSLKQIFYIFAPAYVIGIPLLLEGLVYTQVVLPGLRNEAEAKIRYGYFYSKYNPSTWWWELTFLLRKLCVPAVKMFTDDMVTLVQITAAFLLFLVFALIHNLAKPFIEEGCNFCDTLALSAHVFVMFAGAMYQTGRLGGALSSSYAYLFIVINTGVGSYLFDHARKEVCECLPVIGMGLSSKFWVYKTWPFVFASVRYRLFGRRYKTPLGMAADEFFSFFYKHDEVDYRAEMAHRLRRQPMLSDVGRAKAKQWIRDYSSTMRDGLLYNDYLNNCKAEINRSVFVYMVTSPRYIHTNQFEYTRYDKWLSSFGSSIRIMRKHITADTRMLKHYNVGTGISGYDMYRTQVSLGSVDVEKLLEQFIPSATECSARERTHNTEYRPYVDFDGSGNYYLCFINRVFSMSDITVSLCSTGAPPHLNKDRLADRLYPVQLPDPQNEFSVSVKYLRVYSRVAIRDHDGEEWPGEITRACPDGSFRVRDPIHGEYAFPVSREDLACLGPTLDHPVGYIWHGFGEEEDEREVSTMSRDDLVVYVHSTEAISSERIPCKTQIEWLQSRLVLSPACMGGRDSASWACAGYADGTVDVWSSLDGTKMFMLQHGEAATSVWITPTGNIIVSMSANYLVYWDMPKDRDLGNPARLPNCEPWHSRFFQAESLSSDLFEAEERQFTEFLLPDELMESTVVAIGNATAVDDETSMWVVAVNEESVLLYSCSQRHGFLRSQVWPQPKDDIVVAAEICQQDKKTSGSATMECTTSDVGAGIDGEKDNKEKNKGKLKLEISALDSGSGTRQLKKDASRAGLVSKIAPTQIIVLTTQLGEFFTVHCGGFPTLSVTKEKTKQKKKRATSTPPQKSAEVEKEGGGRGSVTRDSGFPRKKEKDIPINMKVSEDIWTHGGSIIQRIHPEREREHRMSQVDKVEAQIKALWREHNQDNHSKGQKHPDRSSNTSDKLEDEIRLIKRRLLDMEPGVGRDRYQAAVELMVKKKGYLDKHDVQSKVLDSFVCGQTMRAVLLIQEDPINRRTAARSRWFMRLLELKRDPRVSPRNVAPRYIFVKLDDSCDVTEKWPRTDPSFFDNVAVSIIARSLGREANGYDGSFSYMSSKHFFESTLDIAFDHMVEERRLGRLAGMATNVFGAASIIAAGPSSNDAGGGGRGGVNKGGRLKKMRFITAHIEAPTHGLGFVQKAGCLLHIDTVNYGMKDAIDAKTKVTTGDRIVSIDGDVSYAFMEPAVADAKLLQLLRERERDEPVPISVERNGDLLWFEFDELPLGLTLRSKENLLLIDQAPKGQPASVAGLLSGDRIVRVEGNDSFAILSVAEAMCTLTSFLLPPPHSVTIEVLRSPSNKDNDKGLES